MILVSLFLVLMLGCGEEGGFPPVLTDVRYQTDAYLKDFKFRDEYPAMTGVVSFEDPDGDVVLLTISWQDCKAKNRLDIIQEDLKKTAAGEIPFIVVIRTDCPIGAYTVDLLATDGRGYTSNVMAVPYEIIGSFE